MYTVNNKFEIGEECYTSVREKIKCECPVCKGNGNFIYNSYKVECKQCNGTGKIETNQTVLVVCKVKVNRIKVSILKNYLEIKYKVDCIDDVYRNVRNRQENCLFKTFEGAEKYCKEVNMEQIKAMF